MYKYTLSLNDKNGFPISTYANSRQAAVTILWRRLIGYFPRRFTREEINNMIVDVQKIQLDIGSCATCEKIKKC